MRDGKTGASTMNALFANTPRVSKGRTASEVNAWIVRPVVKLRPLATQDTGSGHLGSHTQSFWMRKLLPTTCPPEAMRREQSWLLPPQLKTLHGSWSMTGCECTT